MAWEDIKGKRVGIYCRVSSEEQKEGKNVESQISDLQKLAKEAGAVEMHVYKEEGWSGGVLARPELDRLRDDVAMKKLDVVLVNDLDRLARDNMYIALIKRDFDKHHVPLIIRNAPMIGNGPTGTLMLNMLGSFAEFERLMIADRTRRGTRHKAEVRKLFVGSMAKYGYRYILKDKQNKREGYLEVVPEHAKIVRMIFEWIGNEGLSQRKVCERLMAAGIPAPKGGRVWGTSTIARITKDPVYTGVWYWNKNESVEPKFNRTTTYKKQSKSSRRLRPTKEWVPVPLPKECRIISQELFDKVQAQFLKNTQLSPRNNHKHNYLLRSLIKCGNKTCGHTWSGTPMHGKPYYRCGYHNVKYTGRSDCKIPSIKADKLDGIVWGAVEETVLTPGIIIDQVKAYAKKDKEQESRAGNNLQEVQTLLKNLDKEEERILEAYRASVITMDQLQKELEKVRERRGPLEKERRELAKDGVKQLPLAVIKQGVEKWCEEVQEEMEEMGLERQQKFLQEIVDRIIIETEKVRILLIVPVTENAKLDCEHNKLLVGPPGTGKTLLARALAGILPPLTREEAYVVTSLYSVAGLLPEGRGLIRTRPFRNPHHGASSAALVGGGSHPRPGEVSLAHHGVLFLDELPEFSRQVLDQLRQPIEDGVVTVARASHSLRFPARSMLVAAMNPCKCGFVGSIRRPCNCAPHDIIRYQQRVSGPLLDRFDLHVLVADIPVEELLTGERTGLSSTELAAQAAAAREHQYIRQGKTNAALTVKELKKFTDLDDVSKRLLYQAERRFHLSSRGVHRLLKVSRTIADLEGSDGIQSKHLAEALQYREQLKTALPDFV